MKNETFMIYLKQIRTVTISHFSSTHQAFEEFNARKNHI